MNRAHYSLTRERKINVKITRDLWGQQSQNHVMINVINKRIGVMFIHYINIRIADIFFIYLHMRSKPRIKPVT